MLLSTLKAPPPWQRFLSSHPGHQLIAGVVAALVALPAARAQESPPLSLDEALRLASDRSPQIAAQRSAIDSAQQASVAARQQAMLGDVQLALRRDVAGAWIERYFAQRMAAVVDEQTAEVQLQADTMQAGVATGKAQPAELLAVKVSLQTLLDKRADFDKQAARAKVMLARWLGNAAARPLAPFALPAAPA